MDDDTTIMPMTPEQTRARSKLLKKLTRGATLDVVKGLKKGREAIFQAAHSENPWLLRVLIDRAPRVVRFDFVELRSPS